MSAPLLSLVGRPRLFTRRLVRPGGPVSEVPPRVNVRVQIWDASSPALERAAANGVGRLLQTARGHNRVPTAGRNLLRDLLNGDSLSGITDFALGTSATATTNSDTALGAEVHRAAVTRTVKSTLQLTVQYFLSSTLLNGQTLREAGLLTDEDTLFARYLLVPAIAKNSGIAVTFTWDIAFMNLLELPNMVELSGSQDNFQTGNAYPSGAELASGGGTAGKLVPGSSVWQIDSEALADASFGLQGHVKVFNGTAKATIALFNLDDAPDTPLTGSAVQSSAGVETGELITSGAITFPAGGTPKRLGVKMKTDEVGGDVAAWGLRIVRL